MFNGKAIFGPFTCRADPEKGHLLVYCFPREDVRMAVAPLAARRVTR